METPRSDCRLHAIARGRVQGVGYRFFAQRAASSFGLSGIVRNQRDGAVEVLAEGSRGALERLLEALQRGPVGAEVEAVDAEWSAATGEYAHFHIRH